MNEDFLQKIEQPTEACLQDLYDTAVETVETQLTEFGATDIDPWALRKIAYAYYYDWEHDDPNYVFLLKDPGPLKQRHTRSVRRLEGIKDDADPRSLIDIYRGFAKTWFTDTRNSDFMRRFLSTCRVNDLISFDSYWGDYIKSDGFFEDFYMTDIIKYRAPGDAIGSREVQASFTEQLRPELATIDPDLIFAFGNRAWTPLAEELNPEPVGTPYLDHSKITDLHGHLHWIGGELATHVLPVGHMSTNFFGTRLSKQAYMSRLEEGLQQWKQR